MNKEEEYICIEECFKFKLYKKYTLIYNRFFEGEFKITVGGVDTDMYGTFSQDYIDRYFILKKVYDRNQILNDLLND